MSPQTLSSMKKPSSVKSRFAYGFLRALKRLNKSRPTSSSSYPREVVLRRYRMIKMAADASMASAVGRRRAWSRAMLRRIRRHVQAQRGLMMRRIRRSCCSGGFERRGQEEKKDGTGFVFDDLRKVVPGGETMDSCRLLDETAHYIKCLNTQVQISRRVL